MNTSLQNNKTQLLLHSVFIIGLNLFTWFDSTRFIMKLLSYIQFFGIFWENLSCMVQSKINVCVFFWFSQEKSTELVHSTKSHQDKIENLEQSINNLQQDNKNLRNDYKKACELADQKGEENTDLLYKWQQMEVELGKLRQRLHLTEEDLTKAKESEK